MTLVGVVQQTVENCLNTLREALGFFFPPVANDIQLEVGCCDMMFIVRKPEGMEQVIWMKDSKCKFF